MVFFYGLEAFLRILPVLADMSRSPSMLIVIIIVELIVCKRVLVSHKSNIIRNVLLLDEVFDVETQIYDTLFMSNGVKILHEEAACNFVDHSSRQLQYLFNLSVRIVSISRYFFGEILIFQCC